MRPNQPHEAALERGEHGRELVTPLEHHAMLANERERPLLQAKLGAFLDSDLRALAVPPICREHRRVGIHRSLSADSAAGFTDVR